MIVSIDLFEKASIDHTVSLVRNEKLPSKGTKISFGNIRCDSTCRIAHYTMREKNGGGSVMRQTIHFFVKSTSVNWLFVFLAEMRLNLVQFEPCEAPRVTLETSCGQVFE